MSQDRVTSDGGNPKTSYQKLVASSYYGLLGVHPSASVREIRQAYRDLSKLYHPDTTALSREVATSKFQQLNEAYATLSSPERRLAYDQKIGYSRVAVVQSLPNLNSSFGSERAYSSSSAYLDATDRPLSPGEIFALFILGVTFLACLVLAITIGFTRGETILKPDAAQAKPAQEVTIPHSTQAKLKSSVQSILSTQSSFKPQSAMPKSSEKSSDGAKSLGAKFSSPLVLPSPVVESNLPPKLTDSKASLGEKLGDEKSSSPLLTPSLPNPPAPNQPALNPPANAPSSQFAKPGYSDCSKACDNSASGPLPQPTA